MVAEDHYVARHLPKITNPPPHPSQQGRSGLASMELQGRGGQRAIRSYKPIDVAHEKHQEFFRSFGGVLPSMPLGRSMVTTSVSDIRSASHLAHARLRRKVLRAFHDLLRAPLNHLLQGNKRVGKTSTTPSMEHQSTAGRRPTGVQCSPVCSPLPWSSPGALDRKNIIRFSDELVDPGPPPPAAPWPQSASHAS